MVCETPEFGLCVDCPQWSQSAHPGSGPWPSPTSARQNRAFSVPGPGAWRSKNQCCKYEDSRFCSPLAELRKQFTNCHSDVRDKSASSPAAPGGWPWVLSGPRGIGAFLRAATDGINSRLASARRAQQRLQMAIDPGIKHEARGCHHPRVSEFAPPFARRI